MRKQQRLKQAQKIVATHEAGHAVVARVLGVKVSFVSMFPTDEGGTPGAQTHSAAYTAGMIWAISSTPSKSTQPSNWPARAPRPVIRTPTWRATFCRSNTMTMTTPGCSW